MNFLSFHALLGYFYRDRSLPRAVTIITPASINVRVIQCLPDILLCARLSPALLLSNTATAHLRQQFPGESAASDRLTVA